jgi:hypothetical protein
MELEEGGWPRSGAVEMSADGGSDVMENAEAARQNAATSLCNGSVRVLERIRLLGHWAGVVVCEWEL